MRRGSPKGETVKREVREYTRGMGYALPRPVRRWLEGQIAGLREPLKLAIIRLANLVGRYHTGPKVGGRDFCLARQPKRKGRELDGGILTNPEWRGSPNIISDWRASTCSNGGSWGLPVRQTGPSSRSAFRITLPAAGVAPPPFTRLARNLRLLSFGEPSLALFKLRPVV